MTEPFDFNPLDPELRRDPFESFARGRAERPLMLHEGLPVRVWSAFLYRDCEAIHRDAATWSSDLSILDDEDPPELAACGPPPPQSMLELDSPVHTRVRGFVNKAFTPRIVQRLSPRMEELARTMVADVLDECRRKGEVDLVEKLTYPLPLTVISEVIGVPTSELDQFREWSDRLISLLDAGLFAAADIEQLKEQRHLVAEMRAFFLDLAEHRRRSPREDLISGLVAAEHDGARIQEREFLQILGTILVAGSETTTTLIGNAVLEFLAHPDELERVRSDGSLLPSAIEEVMRFSTPVQSTLRRATRATELQGEEFQENDLVLCWLASANRDESVFERADVFDVGREDNRHLGFGLGAHFCLGATLARLEARIALGAFLQATRSFERSTEGPLPLHPSPIFRGFTSLPLRLEAA